MANIPNLTWRDNDTPVSTRFDDPYFSVDNGLAETEHVFIAGNDLQSRLAPDFHVAELGFGTGLNLLALARMTHTLPIKFTSFEAFPLSRDDLTRALARWDELGDLRTAFIDAYQPQGGVFQLHAITVDLRIGDARETLPVWNDKADAWFLDGFSPARNPELWGADLMAEVARHTATGGTFATYSAAGFIRAGLADAGFDVRRIPGYGRKRHMSVGTLA